MGEKDNWISSFHDELASISSAVFELHAKSNAFRFIGLHRVAEELDYLAHAIDTSARGMEQAVSKHVTDEYDASTRSFNSTFTEILEIILKDGE